MSESSPSKSSAEPDMAHIPATGGLPPDLKFLKRLVTILTATMIAGLLVIVALLVIRLGKPSVAPIALPEAIALPKGLRATAITAGDNWYAVVTDSQEILIYDRATGAIAQRIAIELR